MSLRLFISFNNSSLNDSISHLSFYIFIYFDIFYANPPISQQFINIILIIFNMTSTIYQHNLDNLSKMTISYVYNIMLKNTHNYFFLHNYVCKNIFIKPFVLYLFCIFCYYHKQFTDLLFFQDY